jgi:hypothetical protein
MDTKRFCLCGLEITDGWNECVDCRQPYQREPSRAAQRRRYIEAINANNPPVDETHPVVTMQTDEFIFMSFMVGDFHNIRGKVKPSSDDEMMDTDTADRAIKAGWVRHLVKTTPVNGGVTPTRAGRDAYRAEKLRRGL